MAPGELLPVHLPGLQREFESGVRLFVQSGHEDQVFEQLAELARLVKAPVATDESVPLEIEADIVHARQRTRALALLLGADEFTAQRALTAASELARNVILYAKRGRLDILPRSATRTLFLRSVDRGPGIADLTAVLDGRYKSRTGLGKGLRGVRRLSTHFDVQTSAAGTTVEAEIAL